MNKDGHIDLEKISKSIETLSSMENIVNVVDFTTYFDDIEKCFRQINFEHANCVNYKESMDIIYSDLNNIKKKINELSGALRRTKLNYTSINKFTDDDIKEFTDIYKMTPASEDLSKLIGEEGKLDASKLAAAMTTETAVATVPLPEPAKEKEPINTIPIGIAIGATGIAGSVGAVIVDEVYTRRQRHDKKIDKKDVYLEEYTQDTIDEENDGQEGQNEISQGPYHAARMSREADRFYGNEIEKMKLEGNEEYLEAAKPENDDDDDDENDDYGEF